MNRADFNIAFDNVKKATGYVKGELTAIFENGKIIAFDFKPLQVVLYSMIAVGPVDFAKLEKVAKAKCKICVE